MTISFKSKSRLLHDYFTEEQTDSEQTMKLSCFKSKPNMVADAQAGHTRVSLRLSVGTSV